jgi:hypothetical protein
MQHENPYNRKQAKKAKGIEKAILRPSIGL